MHYPPLKVLLLAEQAFAGDYPREVLVRWLKQFYRRFSVSNSSAPVCRMDLRSVRLLFHPRDWRMPSDASSALWLAELESL